MDQKRSMRVELLSLVAGFLMGMPHATAQYVLDSVPDTEVKAHLLADRPKYHNQIKFSPIRVVDPVNPGYELSYERSYGRFSTQMAGALLADPFSGTDNDQYTGVRVAIEQKLFFGHSPKVRPYVAMELVFHKIDIRRKDLFTDDPRSWRYHGDDSLYAAPYEDDYRIEKSMSTLSGKVGIQALLGRVVLDFGYGVGIKWRTVRHFDRTAPSDRLSGGFGVKQQAYSEGSWTTLVMPLNFKVGLLF